jgi:cyclohexanone monooxygenase
MTSSSQPIHDTVIVGAGFSGLYLIQKFRKLGFTVRAFEAAADVGGTWYWNQYPGARCDVESLEYSFSFSEDLQQDWEWSERYATQPEILRYAKHVADRFELRSAISFKTRVVGAEFDPSDRAWTIWTDKGEQLRARFFIMAGGNLSIPRMPEFPGRDEFQGRLYHTGGWPHEPVDFSGLRVGVIGTGSSGVQVIPEIAKQATHVTVFQRTPNYCSPARNFTVPQEKVEWYKRNYTARRERARYSGAGVAAHPVPLHSALAVPPEKRQEAFEAAWTRGGAGILRCFTDILTNPESNELLSDFVRNKIREIVNNPKVAARLTPTDHGIGTKRICVDSNYYATFNRDNVDLVDLRQDPIITITPSGIRTEADEIPLDAIVFATGYDAVTGAMRQVDIRIKDGQRLADSWAEGPRAYLGLLTSGFPNLFMISGPGTPAAVSNAIASIEHQVEWIAECLEYMRERGYRQIQATPDAEVEWTDHVRDVANTTLMPRANSWYMGSNVPGKPRVFLAYLGGLGQYRMRCADVAFSGYPGFELTP